jgi:hypothetical protein
MPLYAAHVVLSIEFTDGGDSEPISLWENIILVSASDSDGARHRAERYSRGDQQVCTWAGRAARWRFRGIRKLVECNWDPTRPDEPGEATYLQLEVAGEAELELLLAGEPMTVTLQGIKPAD